MGTTVNVSEHNEKVKNDQIKRIKDTIPKITDKDLQRFISGKLEPTFLKDISNRYNVDFNRLQELATTIKLSNFLASKNEHDKAIEILNTAPKDQHKKMSSWGYEKEFNAITLEVNQSFQDFQRDIFLNSAIENIMTQLYIIKSIMSKYSEEKEDEETDEDTIAEKKDNIKKESDAVKEIETIFKNLDDGMIKNAVGDCLNVLQHGDLETKQNAIETLEETLKQIANPLRIEIKRGFAGELKIAYLKLKGEKSS